MQTYDYYYFVPEHYGTYFRLSYTIPVNIPVIMSVIVSATTLLKKGHVKKRKRGRRGKKRKKRRRVRKVRKKPTTRGSFASNGIHPLWAEFVVSHKL